MRAVTFSNPGELDLTAFTTFGVSAKDGDNPIGHFGTGIKYALAILLRSGCKMTIWKGDEMLLMGSEEVEVRGKTFRVLTMDGERLGYTTDVGKDWPFWTAFRELVCNCIDEGGETYAGAPRLGHVAPGRTTIMVEGDEFFQVYVDREDYVMSTQPFLHTTGIDIHRGESKHLFYRGVRIYEMERPAKYRYSFTEDIELTEDRTLRSWYEAKSNLTFGLSTCNDENFLREILTLPSSYMEHHLDYEHTATYQSPAFHSVTAELYHSKEMVRLNPSCFKLMSKEVEARRDKYASVEPTPIEALQLERAYMVVRLLGLEPSSYDVRLVDSLGTGMLGEWRDGKAFISRRALAMGTKMAAGTLYEELLHGRDNLIDESRHMQNYLIDEVMTLVERHILKEPI